jgi:hypothetical protein
MALFERSRILAGQADFIVSSTLGDRPSRSEPHPPDTLHDLLLQSLQTMNRVHEDYESITRHVAPSTEEVAKESAHLRNVPVGAQPGDLIRVDDMERLR